MKTEERTYEYCRHDFTHDELFAIHEQLAKGVRGIYDLREQKKDTTAELSGAIKHAEAEVALLVRKVENGYEDRRVETIILYNDPKVGRKTVVRVDTNDTIRIEDMTDLERQQNLFGDTQ